MKILLADDERLIRLGIKCMIEEIEPNIHTFIEAKNGKELVKLYKENAIDLAFVDITMPLLDGLSAIEECNPLTHHTKWFVLTGEKEFHLVKKAISLGVTDYLVKPIGIEGLKPIILNTKVSKVKQMLEENNSFELSVISTFNSLLANGTTVKLPTSYKSDFSYEACLFTVDGLENIVDSQIVYGNIKQLTREFMEDRLSHSFRFGIYNLTPSSFILIISGKDHFRTDFSSLLTNLQGGKYSTTITREYGLSNIFSCYEKLSTITEYSSLRVLKRFRGCISVINYPLLEFNDVLLFCKYILDVVNYYYKKEELHYKDAVYKLNDNLKLRKLYETLDKTFLNEFLKLTMNFNFDYSRKLSQFINEILLHGGTIYNQAPKSTTETLIDEIIDYTKSHYMEDIGVNTIANLYDITPNYLSKIFHDKTKMKFIDYITTIRIKESKKILTLYPTTSIKEVSERVGYHSPRHFTKQFQKVEGISPSQFLKKV